MGTHAARFPSEYSVAPPDNRSAGLPSSAAMHACAGSNLPSITDDNRTLNRSGRPKSLLRRGAARFVRMKGRGRWEIDPDRIAEAARWDGLHGVATNVRGMFVEELLARCRGLRQVERSFRRP